MFCSLVSSLFVVAVVVVIAALLNVNIYGFLLSFSLCLVWHFLKLHISTCIRTRLCLSLLLLLLLLSSLLLAFCCSVSLSPSVSLAAAVVSTAVAVINMIAVRAASVLLLLLRVLLLLTMLQCNVVKLKSTVVGDRLSCQHSHEIHLFYFTTHRRTHLYNLHTYLYIGTYNCCKHPWAYITTSHVVWLQVYYVFLRIRFLLLT